MLKKISIFLLLMLAGASGFYCAIHNKPAKDIATTTLRTYHYPASFVTGLKNDPKAGEKIYQQYCQTCHASNPAVDVHAPALGNTALWQALQQSLGEERMWQFTLMGHNAMPARGGCFECSDEQLRQAMLYLQGKTLK